MENINFLPDDRENRIITALLSGQKTITIDRVEIFLKPLKRDTRWAQEMAAQKQAKELIKVL